jgi:uncharacterized protein
LKIAGTYQFQATRDEVWSALNDPEVLARTIPGCQRLDQVGPDEYESTLKIGLQAVRGVYSGRVKIYDQQAPESYKLSVDGKGSNGFLKGSGGLVLREADGVTTLEYQGDAQIGGTIASVGQRLIDGAAKTLIGQSLKALQGHIEARRTAAATEPPAVEPAPAESTPAAVNVTADRPAAAAEPTAAAAAATPAASAAPTVERRSFTVPPGEGLSETDVAFGVIEDFVKQRPWLPWVVIAFLVGYLFGRR